MDCVGEEIKPGPLKDGVCVTSGKFSGTLSYCSCKKPTTTPPPEETNENVTTTGKPMTTSPESTGTTGEANEM